MMVSADRNRDAATDGAGVGRPSEREGLFTPIIDEILSRHHRYVREEVPRIKAVLDECADGCGESAEAIGAVTRFFDGLAKELDAHLLREEDELFPALRAAEEGRRHERLGPVIRKLRAEHDHAGDALTQTHVALAEALVPEGAHPKIKELHGRLQAFEEDLRAHVRAEDLLFARATGLDKQKGGRAAPVVGQ
ncbi:MAG: hemerythrin domain-containing protein [Planctomycetota bacterium]|jgi:regulator of cell morphogenesis and NO signaling